MESGPLGEHAGTSKFREVDLALPPGQLGSAGFNHSNLSVEALCPSDRSDESTKSENSNGAKNPMTSHKWKEKDFQNTYMIEDLYSNYTNNYRTNSPIRNGFISEQETYLASEDSKQAYKNMFRITYH